MELPVEFKEYAIDALGEETAQRLFVEIGNGVEMTSVRLNPTKMALDGNLAGRFEKEGIELSPVPWSRNGYYLSQRPVFTLDPLFHAGAYYVQEASSQYMELAAGAIEKDFSERGILPEGSFFGQRLNALDLCAAPGGKTTHLVSLLGDDSLLVSNEVIKSRSVILADNVAKWGADNIVVTNNDPADFKAFEGFFDLVVVDAPCSGEGLFRKDSAAVGEWSPANVNLCAQRQQRILADIWPALKPGGYLIYSTCTYNKFENDGNLQWLAETFGCKNGTLSFFETALESGVIRTPGGGLQFVPCNIKGEGQFMAVVRKEGEWEASHPFIGGKSSKGKKQVQIEKGCNYLPDSYIKILQGDLVKAYREELYERIRFVEENLKIVLSGIAVAEKKGKDYVPHADFALQQMVGSMVKSGTLPAGISAVEVCLEDALKFLAKEPVVLSEAPKGFVLVVYHGLGLGFVKNLGNRTNNLLPMARRIRMSVRQ